MAFLLDFVALHGTSAAVAVGLRLMRGRRVEVVKHSLGNLQAYVKDDDGEKYYVKVEYGADFFETHDVACNCYQFSHSGGEHWCSHIIAALFAEQQRAGRARQTEADLEAARAMEAKAEAEKAARALELKAEAEKAAKALETKAEAEKAAMILETNDDEENAGWIRTWIDLERIGLALESVTSGEKQTNAGSKDPEERSARSSNNRRSDNSAAKLLELYRARQAGAARAFAQAEGESPYVVEATLVIPYSPQYSNYYRYSTYYKEDKPKLRFRIGRKGERMYVLRNLDDFTKGFASSQMINYGKLTVTLNRASFAEESLPLLDFILSRYEAPDYRYRYRADDNKEIPLGPDGLDEFLTLYRDRELAVVHNGTAKKVMVCEANFPAELLLSKGEEDAGEDGIWLSCEEDFTVLEAGRRCYALHQKTLYRCSEAYANACERLLNALDHSGGSLYFSKRDVPALFSNILKKAGLYLRIEEGEGVEAEMPPELVTKVWFDLSDSGEITARMAFFYGDAGFDAFDDKKSPGKSFDPAGEIYAETILHRYMGYTFAAPGTLLMEAGGPEAKLEERVFLLAAFGVEEIRGFAEVYVSESFDAIKARPPLSVSVGVKVEGRLLKIDFDAEGLDFAELAEVLNSYRRAKKYHRLRDGSFLLIEENSGLAELSDLADGLGLSDGDIERGTASVDRNRAFYINAMYKKNEALRYNRDVLFKDLVRKMKDSEYADFSLPQGLSGVLRGYQEEGFHWLKTLDALGFGGVLADDMGLGKTLQALALIESASPGLSSAESAPQALSRSDSVSPGLPYAESAQPSPSIIVCPASLVLNWESEAKRFTPGLKVHTVLGSAKERAGIIGKARKSKSPVVLVTSYDLLKRDTREYEGMEFRFIILDEAQYIKNQTTQNAKAVKIISGQTRLALTGTPVENNLAELWSIFDFLMPGYLWNYNRFRRKYEIQITKFNDVQAEARLRELVRPFLLRRLKSAVLRELPEKIETVQLSVMESEQRKLYLANLAQAKKDLAKRLKEAGAPQGRVIVLAALTRMRQICCDPALLYEGYKGGSAKLEACIELVRNCLEGGHRILLFSQFTSMLDILEKRLRKEGIDWYRLDGATPKTERFSLMNAFNEGGAPVFLISLRAGGTGLNLTGADIVIHYDPWWNLSVQNQATDRAHRIGQENRVQVFKLIIKDTIEERILDMQARKAELVEKVIREGGDALDKLSEEELLSLFEG